MQGKSSALVTFCLYHEVPEGDCIPRREDSNVIVLVSRFSASLVTANLQPFLFSTICRMLCSGSRHFSYCPHSPWIFISQLLRLFITRKHPSCGHHKGALLSASLLTDKISQNIFCTHCTLSHSVINAALLYGGVLHNKHKLSGAATAASCFLIRYC